MRNSFKRFTAVLLIFLAIFSFTCAMPVCAEAVTYSKPANFHFVCWNNTQFTSCRFAWNTAYDSAGNAATDYEIRETWTNGTHYWHGFTTKRVVNINKHEYNHVVVASVRARWKLTNEKTGSVFYIYSQWSNPVYVTPWPRSAAGSVPDSRKPYVSLRWNTVYCSSGYNIFLTQNPKGTWYWNQATTQKATSTTATIKSFRSAKLKTYANYYVRIVTRRKLNGAFCTVPAPGSGYYSLRFRLTKAGK